MDKEILNSKQEMRLKDLTDIVIIGNSQAILSCKEKIDNIAKTDITIFLQGETGTGKDLLARYIHSVSNRRKKPFATVNCANSDIPHLTDELFGHEKWSYSKYTRLRRGKTELADSGTLYLDMIGDTPRRFQKTLLGFLDNRTYLRLGTIKEKKFQGRIIASNNNNLDELVLSNKFDKGLYFSLKHFSITLPPLRERREDIPLLIEYFLKNAGTKLSQPSLAMNEESFDFLMKYLWPGNLRELQGVVEAAVINSHGEIIQTKHLPICQDALITRNHLPVLTPVKMPEIIVKTNPLKDVMKKTQKDLVLKALEDSKWNQTEAARTLGMTRQNLIKLMKKHELSIVKGYKNNDT